MDRLPVHPQPTDPLQSLNAGPRRIRVLWACMIRRVSSLCTDGKVPNSTEPPLHSCQGLENGSVRYQLQNIQPETRKLNCFPQPGYTAQGHSVNLRLSSEVSCAPESTPSGSALNDSMLELLGKLVH